MPAPVRELNRAECLMAAAKMLSQSKPLVDKYGSAGWAAAMRGAILELANNIYDNQV